MAGVTGEQDWYVSGVFSMSFINLNDTFGDYVGRAGLVPKVNAAEDALIPSDTEIDSHSARHEDEGADEMSVQGLLGVLAEKQEPKTHHSSHEDGGADEMSVQGLFGVLGEKQEPKTHHSSHEDGGADEMSVQNLTGDLADAQDPKTHHSSHEDGGADQISNLGGIVTFPDQSAFRVFRDSNQNITVNEWEKVLFNSYSHDIQGEFSTGSDRFIPIESGVYLFSALVTLDVAAAGDRLLLEIKKDGNRDTTMRKTAAANNYYSLSIVTIISVGIPSYVEVFVRNADNNDTIIHGPNSTFLSGIKIA